MPKQAIPRQVCRTDTEDEPDEGMLLADGTTVTVVASMLHTQSLFERVYLVPES